ncbi:Similar to Phosphatidylinositol 4-phosphate 5-kinase type-1 gamma; acc. no. O60331 [Pyronema omphalodes CBS 100304]|uniref:Similar to Phosphatidylinositol 4-phosphate 5-kinase type-1 gamma acc. no. O60331 n=1 Tax=Pyronema omphalodes (strain CBS 100304) TaxID=1076935 RepID=U4L4M9_PYROM|nr:Similar to Phosphatidylinositol 4-phosphate 5-kinase type-1 gamma; acc. no. O60331 [Pyronema omphalodes CBS 100304]
MPNHENNDHHHHPHEVEGPQIYDWSHALQQSSKHTLIGRMVIPFFSARYKTALTAACLLRALNERVLPREEEAIETTQLLKKYGKGSLTKPPAADHTFRLNSFFSLYHANFHRAAPLLFYTLRKDCYGLDEEHYQKQFEKDLKPVDGLGFSGSLFYYTQDKSLIVKSVGRKFEYTFMYEKMIEGFTYYYSMMISQKQQTLLCQITDVVGCHDHRLGGWLGVSPSHYIVMTNVLEGLDKEKGCKKWDLKPQNFFEPTRDLVPDQVKTENAKSGLADELDEEMVLTRKDKQTLMMQLERDTEFLADMKTIDYSLLLGRWPVDMFHAPRSGEGRDPMVLPEEDTKDFVRGVRSADGKWVYKMVLLDFFWNVEQLKPKIMQTAGKLLPEQTVTTEPDRYREEFLKMMDKYILVWEDMDEDERLQNSVSS